MLLDKLFIAWNQNKEGNSNKDDVLAGTTMEAKWLQIGLIL